MNNTCRAFGREFEHVGLICSKVFVVQGGFTAYCAIDVQDGSLQCLSNAICPFTIYLYENDPSKRNPKLRRCHLKSLV